MQSPDQLSDKSLTTPGRLGLGLVALDCPRCRHGRMWRGRRWVKGSGGEVALADGRRCDVCGHWEGNAGTDRAVPPPAA